MLKKLDISASSLKILALISMIIDHIGVLLQNNFTTFNNIAILLRLIGRISFPIYAFLILEGFLRTKNFTKYFLRLGILALISEIPFDLFLFNKFFDFSYQNTIFTYLLALLMLYLLNKYKYNRYIYLAIVALFSTLAYILKTDYSYIGIIYIALLYTYRNSKLEAFVLSSITLLSQFPAMLSFIPLYFYKGKQGRYKLKYLFYIAYPLHLLILYLIKDYFIL